jgi:gliding motility-associated lipoprotein GldD
MILPIKFLRVKHSMKKTAQQSILFVAILFFGLGCQTYTPKPHGYPRIHFPVKEYHSFSEHCHFTFEIPKYAQMQLDTSEGSEPCWYNLLYSQFNATIYLSYKKVADQDELNTLTEEAYKLAMKNNIKADVINETEIIDTTSGNYGIVYDLYGETATPFNFYITDNESHFLRGAFYFDEHTKTDSVAPVFDYLKEDIVRMINTLQWK